VGKRNLGLYRDSDKLTIVKVAIIIEVRDSLLMKGFIDSYIIIR
jgi:hypothetical protein